MIQNTLPDESGNVESLKRKSFYLHFFTVSLRFY